MVAGKSKRRKARDKAKSKPVVPQRQELSTRSVEDPYDAPNRLTVNVNVLEHPAEMLRARGVLGETEYKAAGRFRRTFEAAGIGGARGIDPTREAVDGGAMPAPAINAAAFDALRRYRRFAGLEGYAMLVAVIGVGRGLGEVIEAYRRVSGVSAERARHHLTQVLVEALLGVAVADGARAPASGSVIRFARDLGIDMLIGNERDGAVPAL